MAMPWIFLMVAWLFVFGVFRRRRWRRWDGPGPYGEYLDKNTRTEMESRAREREAQIDLLESRVAELESRLDYTERLLTQRRDPEPLPG